MCSSSSRAVSGVQTYQVRVESMIWVPARKIDVKDSGGFNSTKNSSITRFPRYNILQMSYAQPELNGISIATVKP